MDEELKQNLRVCRSVIANLLDKAWEMGGYTVGEQEFEGYYWVKDARSQIEEIDKILKH